MTDLVNRRDIDFLLYEWLDLPALCAHERYAQHDRATFEQVIDAAYRLAVEQFMPHAAKADANEPHFDGTRVEMIPEVGEALRAYVAGGFLAASFDADRGGMQLPYTINAVLNGIFTAANIGTTGYAFLTVAAANLLCAHGSPDQQRRYLQPMIEGRWFGTMCLSEPQAGSSLGDIRTRAIPQPDGSYHLVGNKMWISGGEHELTENIVNLVLARIDGAPAGTKGISLFIVPKRRVDADGKLGARNGVRLAGLNHKMGYRGTTNCALNFGESEAAVGEIVGAPNHGLAAMFHMMNEARIVVGMGAAMLGYAGYRFSLDYAKTRSQGRPIAAKDPLAKPVSIIEHADVRRMLLQQKAWVEGGTGLALYCAKLIDELGLASGDAREELRLLLEILTPIAKSWPSEYCLEANKQAIQILGGYGYTRDYPVERLYRDNRLNPIHEGTLGIQAIDLLGRKATMKGGAALKLLLARMATTLDGTARMPELAEFRTSLQVGIDVVVRVTRTLTEAAAQGQIERSLANATLYLDMLGNLVVAWLWLDQARVALNRASNAGAVDQPFYEGKLNACRYFYRYELPRALRYAELLESLDDTVLKTPISCL